MTYQPKWKCIAQLGDANPLEHGGIWVSVDELEIYCPELEVLEVPDDLEKGIYYVRRFLMEDCTYINGVLSDNKYHPDYAAWFADKLTELGSFIGADESQLVAWFCSADPCDRKIAWMAVYDYFGSAELDEYPLMLNQTEVEKRYEFNERYWIKE